MGTMIVDQMNHYAVYCGAVPGLEAGMQFVQTLLDKPAGTYHNEAYDGMFAMVQEGTGVPLTGPFESHEKRLDVQIVLEGQESMDWADTASLTPSQPYSDERDCALYTGSGARMVMSAGMFYLLFPHDGHRCCGAVDGSDGHYRKIVLKIPIQD